MPTSKRTISHRDSSVIEEVIQERKKRIVSESKKEKLKEKASSPMNERSLKKLRAEFEEAARARLHNPAHFFSNKECPYFPCHKGIEESELNCLFCFCVLYKTLCPGKYSYTKKDGIKDCSACTFPHEPKNYERIIDILSKRK